MGGLWNGSASCLFVPCWWFPDCWAGSGVQWPNDCGCQLRGWRQHIVFALPPPRSLCLFYLSSYLSLLVFQAHHHKVDSSLYNDAVTSHLSSTCNLLSAHEAVASLVHSNMAHVSIRCFMGNWLGWTFFHAFFLPGQTDFPWSWATANRNAAPPCLRTGRDVCGCSMGT